LAAQAADPTNSQSANSQPWSFYSNYSNARKRLQGTITKSESPFVEGKTEALPEGTKVGLSFQSHLNSEISNKGDEVYSRISVDVKDGKKILLPNGWFIHGTVTEAVKQKRLGRNGYVEVEFDKIISPNGDYELPFPAKFSTKDNRLKAITRIIAIDSGYVAVGGAAGALLSVQLGGIGTAIATYGISVGAGAAVGGTIGLIGALKRKGKIASFYPGDERSITISQTMTLPGFNQEMLEAAAKKEHTLPDLDITINDSKFGKDPFGDSRAKLLTLKLQVTNKGEKEYTLFDLAVVSDSETTYFPFPGQRLWSKKIAPNSSTEATVSFPVGSAKHKYWLVLLDKGRSEELSRVAIN
jgi:hypothetical protein